MKLLRKMKHFLLSLLFALALNSIVNAQTGNISGKITMDREPVVGAVVNIKSLNKQVLTDEKGSYSFKNIPYGNYTLEVGSMEIVAKKQQITVSKPEHVFNLSAKAKDNSLLNEVAITGKTEKRKIETQGFAVNVIDTKEASLRNLQTNELLDRTVGVRIRQNGGLGSNVEYNLNGMSGRAVGIFIDGIEISTFGSSFNLNNIPPAMIERIEVYKGVLPAHLTGDLLGGAINVVLKKGFSHNNINFSASYGSFNTFQSDASLMFRQSKTGLTVRASGFYTDTDNSYKIWGKFARNTMPDGTMEYVTAKRFSDAYRSIGGRVEVGFTNVKWADQFLIGFNGGDVYRELQHGQTMSQPYMGRFTEARSKVLSLNYNKKNFITKGLDLTVNANYSDRETYVQDTVSWVYNWSGEKMIGFHGTPIKTRLGAQQGEPTMNTIERKISTIRSNLGYNIFKGHRLSFNHVYYTVDRYDEDALKVVVDRIYRSENDLQKNVFAVNYEADFFTNRLKTNLFAKQYVQDMTMLNPTRRVVNGQSVFVRDEIKSNKNITGYGLAVSYAISPKYIIITSAEKAVRMPSETEIFGSPDENVTANVSIQPERSDNVNVGFRFGAFDFGKHKISISSNAFWRNVKDKIMRQTSIRRTDDDLELAPFINLGVAQSLGFEGEVSYIYNNNFNFNLNFSKFNSLFKQEFDPNSGLRLEYYNQQIPNEPFFTINGNAQYRINDLFQKSSILSLYYNFGYVAPFSTGWIKTDYGTTPTQFAHDFGASYRFPNRRLVASLDLKNAFNAEIYDNFAVQKPGRSVFFKLNYTIDKF